MQAGHVDFRLMPLLGIDPKTCEPKAEKSDAKAAAKKTGKKKAA